VFEKFWAEYPRKVGKGAAEKAWAKEARLLSDVQEAIFAALEWQKEQEDWIKDNGKYIPYPATYLNQRRWTDERREARHDRGAEPKGFEGLRAYLKHQG
jgi:hypothetical protein